MLFEQQKHHVLPEVNAHGRQDYEMWHRRPIRAEDRTLATQSTLIIRLEYAEEVMQTWDVVTGTGKRFIR